MVLRRCLTMKYRTLWVVRHVMIEDRLAHVKVDTDDRQGVVTMSLRSGKIHEDLARAMASFSKNFAASGVFELDTNHPQTMPELQAWFELVGDHITGDRPMQPYLGGHNPSFFEILVNENLVNKDLIKELNEEVMPNICGLLVPSSYISH
jgi:hypothetical protein